MVCYMCRSCDCGSHCEPCDYCNCTAARDVLDYDAEPVLPTGAAADFVRLLHDAAAERGSYATTGSMVSLPVVDLPGFGRLPMPLDDAAIARLTAFCEQAPFGQGPTTVVDTSVRNVLQADATGITIANPHFEKELQAAFDQVSSQLVLASERNLMQSACNFRLPTSWSVAASRHTRTSCCSTSLAASLSRTWTARRWTACLARLCCSCHQRTKVRSAKTRDISLHVQLR